MSILAAIVVVTNLGFVTAFDTDKLHSVWVQYDLEPCEVVAVTNKYTPSFTADPNIPGSDLRADYKGSKYDRGHLAPDADFRWDIQALRETYRFSNVCPMTSYLNRGSWEKAEKEIRKLAESGTVHIVTFPLGEKTNKVGRVSVPDRMLKVAWGWFGVRFYDLKNNKKGEE